MYGRSQSSIRESILLTLENDYTKIMFNSTTSGDGASPMYHVDNMEDGDHQLRGLLDTRDTPFEMDYFECVMALLHSILRTV